MRTVTVMFILIAHFTAGQYLDFSVWFVERIPGTPTVCECNVSR